MATYVNDLRLTELATGEGSGTWGTTTNTNLELIGEALGFGTQDCFASDADATTTVADGSTDPARSMFFKVTSSATLSATRTLTIAPNTLSRVMIIENATTGSQSINISQGSGANVTIANGNAKIVYLDGAGSGAAVVDALIDLELADVASATIASSVLTTTDINGGTIDGVTIGGASAGAGSFTTLTASDDVNFDSGTLFVDASENKVGIGTTSPSDQLHIASGAASLRLEDTDNNTYGQIVYNTASGGLLIRSDEGAGAGTGSSNIIFETDGTPKVRIAAGGNVGIGTTSPATLLELSASNNGATANNTLRFTDTDTATQANQQIGQIEFKSDDSSGDGALVRAFILSASEDTTPSAYISFGTNPGGAGNTTDERMRVTPTGHLLVGTQTAHASSSTFAGLTQFPTGASIQKRDSGIVAYFDRLTDDGDIHVFQRDATEVGVIGAKSGDLIIGTGTCGLRFLDGDPSFSPVTTNGGTLNDNAIDLGRATARFDDIFATNDVINTSDANEKQDVAELDEAERRVAVAAKGLLRKFRWINRVEAKGDEARIHFGIVAQDLQAAFEAEGLDAGRYAMFINSTWTDEETGEERSRMGVRYSELLAFIIAAL